MPTEKSFINTLTLNSFEDWDNASSDITLNQNAKGGDYKGCTDRDGFTRICQFKIPKKTAYKIGHPYGIGNGVIFVNFDKTAGIITGKLRIVVSDPTFTIKAIIGTWLTSSMTPATPQHKDLNPQVRPMKAHPWCIEDGYIIVYFKADTDNSVLDVSDADNKLLLPVTWKRHEGR